MRSDNVGAGDVFASGHEILAERVMSTSAEQFWQFVARTPDGQPDGRASRRIWRLRGRLILCGRKQFGHRDTGRSTFLTRCPFS